MILLDETVINLVSSEHSGV